ncbi:MAG: VOC family protein [Clostridium sp.]|uniref:VOC family protein n=1 Tax=Clostridium sp. TaxID=1506 RepID=UPI001D7552F7|nr:VOC family protein [Clostridium sp.]MBS5125625.1 VOC family protein [Clostridium sp.]
MIKEIGKITIYVNNVEEAKKFWLEKMDFIIKFEAEMGPGFKWLEVGPTKEAFTTFVIYNKEMMAKQNPQANVGHPNIILSTTNIESTYSKMKENGVDVDEIKTMPYGSMFSFKDQDGNAYLIREDLV